MRYLGPGFYMRGRERKDLCLNCAQPYTTRQKGQKHHKPSCAREWMTLGAVERQERIERRQRLMEEAGLTCK